MKKNKLEEEFKKHNCKYVVNWYSPIYDRATKKVGFSHFCNDNGYSDEDIIKVKELEFNHLLLLDNNCISVERVV